MCQKSTAIYSMQKWSAGEAQVCCDNRWGEERCESTWWPQEEIQAIKTYFSLQESSWESCERTSYPWQGWNDLLLISWCCLLERAPNHAGVEAASKQIIPGLKGKHSATTREDNKQDCDNFTASVTGHALASNLPCCPISPYDYCSEALEIINMFFSAVWYFWSAQLFALEYNIIINLITRTKITTLTTS